MTPTQNAGSKGVLLSKRFEQGLWLGERDRFASSLLRDGDPLNPHSIAHVHIAKTGWYNASHNDLASNRLLRVSGDA